MRGLRHRASVQSSVLAWGSRNVKVETQKDEENSTSLHRVEKKERPDIETILSDPTIRVSEGSDYVPEADPSLWPGSQENS